jgi:hypothetical protein
VLLSIVLGVLAIVTYKLLYAPDLSPLATYLAHVYVPGALVLYGTWDVFCDRHYQYWSCLLRTIAYLTAIELLYGPIACFTVYATILSARPAMTSGLLFGKGRQSQFDRLPAEVQGYLESRFETLHTQEVANTKWTPKWGDMAKETNAFLFGVLQNQNMSADPEDDYALQKVSEYQLSRWYRKRFPLSAAAAATPSSAAAAATPSSAAAAATPSSAAAAATPSPLVRRAPARPVSTPATPGVTPAAPGVTPAAPGVTPAAPGSTPGTLEEWDNHIRETLSDFSHFLDAVRKRKVKDDLEQERQKRAREDAERAQQTAEQAQANALQAQKAAEDARRVAEQRRVAAETQLATAQQNQQKATPARADTSLGAAETGNLLLHSLIEAMGTMLRASDLAWYRITRAQTRAQDIDRVSEEDEAELNNFVFSTSDGGFTVGDSTRYVNQRFEVVLPSTGRRYVVEPTGNNGVWTATPKQSVGTALQVIQENKQYHTKRQLFLTCGASGDVEWEILLAGSATRTKISDADVLTALKCLFTTKNGSADLLAGTSVAYSFGGHEYTATVESTDPTLQLFPSFSHVNFHSLVPLPNTAALKAMLEDLEHHEGVVGRTSLMLTQLANIVSKLQHCSEWYVFDDAQSELWMQGLRTFLQTILQLRGTNHPTEYCRVLFHGPSDFDSLRQSSLMVSCSGPVNLYDEGIYLTSLLANASAYSQSGNPNLGSGHVLMTLLIIPDIPSRLIKQYQLGPNRTNGDPDEERSHYPHGSDIEDAFCVKCSELVLILGKLVPKERHPRSASVALQ